VFISIFSRKNDKVEKKSRDCVSKVEASQALIRKRRLLWLREDELKYSYHAESLMFLSKAIWRPPSNISVLCNVKQQFDKS